MMSGPSAGAAKRLNQPPHPRHTIIPGHQDPGLLLGDRGGSSSKKMVGAVGQRPNTRSGSTFYKMFGETGF